MRNAKVIRDSLVKKRGNVYRLEIATARDAARFAGWIHVALPTEKSSDDIASYVSDTKARLGR